MNITGAIRTRGMSNNDEYWFILTSYGALGSEEHLAAQSWVMNKSAVSVSTDQATSTRTLTFDASKNWTGEK